MEKQVGALKVIYNEGDYSNKKSKKKLVISILSTILMVLILIVLITGIAYFISKYITDTPKIVGISMTAIIAIMMILFTVLMYIFSNRKIYDGKSGIYQILDSMNDMEDFRICADLSKRTILFRVDYKKGSSQFYGKKYMRIMLDVKEKDVTWNYDFEQMLHNDDNILEIDITQYPKTIFTIL